MPQQNHIIWRAGSKETGGDTLCRFPSLSLILSPKRGLMQWYLQWGSSGDRQARWCVPGSKRGPVHPRTAPGGLVLPHPWQGWAGGLCHCPSRDALLGSSSQPLHKELQALTYVFK